MKNTRSDKGITLVALIITIIVLLILAIVAISAVSGDGILNHAKTAATKTKIAQEEEALRLALDEWKIQSSIPGNEETLEGFLAAKLPEAQITDNGDGGATVVFSPENMYIVSANGQIASVATSATGGIEKKTHNVILNLDNIEYDGPMTFEDGTAFSARLTANEGYYLPIAGTVSGKYYFDSNFLSDIPSVLYINEDGSISLVGYGLGLGSDVTITVKATTRRQFNFNIGSYFDLIAEEGMTWGDWVADPTYNTSGWTVSNGRIENSTYYIVLGSTAVGPDDLISKDSAYSNWIK